MAEQAEAVIPTEAIVAGGDEDGDGSLDGSNDASSDVYAEEDPPQPLVDAAAISGNEKAGDRAGLSRETVIDGEPMPPSTSNLPPGAASDAVVEISLSSPASSSSEASTSDLSIADNSNHEAQGAAAPDQSAPDSDAPLSSAGISKANAGSFQAAENTGNSGSSSRPTTQDATASIDYVDIQKMVDDMSAEAAAAAFSTGQANVSASADLSYAPNGASGEPNAVSLPPKPSMPAQPGPLSHTQAQPLSAMPLSFLGQGAIPQAAAASNVLTGAGAPGTSSDAFVNLPPPPSVPFTGGALSSLTAAKPQPSPGARPGSSDRRSRQDTRQSQQSYEQFIADERRYMLEAKWDRFPDGSRIFVGNLSAEKVSKRDVFDVFHAFGRLAQISLKSAFGFVQYHTVEDAEAAMTGLQGAVIKGRKLNLEFSRTQKRDNKERDRSPDRSRGSRGGGGGRGVDHYEGGRDRGRRGRDDYRPGRSPSPGRRNSGFGRDQHDLYDGGRTRSRSPARQGRHESDSYRRRTPSPYRRPQTGDSPADRLDIPRRYGIDVPDVQLLLLQEVQREFVGWVQKAFYDRGLKSDVMFLNPRFPRDAVLQRQVLEGVHGVIELDLQAQTLAKISLQVFDRSSGASNVRFDQYQNLDPHVAAELVLRAKSQAAAAQQQQPAVYQPPSYAPPYAAATGQPPSQYSYAPPGAPGGAQLQPQQLQQLGATLDNATLQRLLASLQAGQAGAGAAQQAALGLPGGIPQAMPPTHGHPGAAPQIDLNALLGNLKNSAAMGAAPQGQPAAAQRLPGVYGPPAGAYMAAQAPPQSSAALPPGAGSDASQQVQNIMATLAKFRQQ